MMKLAAAEKSRKQSAGFKRSFIRSVVPDKLNTPAGLILLSAFSILFAIAIAHAGFTAGILLLVIFFGLPCIYASVAYPKFGMIALILLSSYIYWFIRMGVNFPLGTLVDGLQALLLIGFAIKQKTKPNWAIYKNPITAIIAIWIIYNFLQFLNPEAESRLAWVYTIRSVALVMLMYFIFLYNLSSKEFIRLVLKVWLAVSLFVALYSIKQEYFGFFEFEEKGLADENVRSLLYIAGHWRKFSIYSDPVVFSYNMVISALLCFGLLWGPLSVVKKVILALLCILFLYVMLFSGTRGAYVLFPAAVFLFSILNFNKKVLIFCVFAGSLLLFLVLAPTSNPYIVRFQTAFRPSEDASFLVRKTNQKRIQPYIQSHPIGGGLGATGVWGQRFAPDSYLANFPPDSGYARVAVELGWVGLFLLCTLLVIVLGTGINNFFRIRDPELKNYCLTMTLIVFALDIGNYPQEALIQFPTPFYFYLVIALINAVYILDQKQNRAQLQDPINRRNTASSSYPKYPASIS